MVILLMVMFRQYYAGYFDVRIRTGPSLGSIYAASIYDTVELLRVSSLTLPNLFGFLILWPQRILFLAPLGTRRRSGQDGSGGAVGAWRFTSLIA